MKRIYVFSICISLVLSACSAERINEEENVQNSKADIDSITVPETISVGTEEQGQEEATVSEEIPEKTLILGSLVSQDVLRENLVIGDRMGAMILETYDCGGYLLKFVGNEEVFWEEEMHMAHPGHKSIYVSSIGNQSYVVVYIPYLMQGDADFSYKVLTWNGDKDELVEEKELQFSFSLYKEVDMPITEIVEYVSDLQSYLENADLLVSVNGDGLHTEEIREDSYDEFNRLIPVTTKEVYEKLQLEQYVALEDKLEKLNEYYKDCYALREITKNTSDLQKEILTTP